MKTKDKKQEKSKKDSKDKEETEIIEHKPKEIDLTLKAPKKEKQIKDIIDDSKFLEVFQRQEFEKFSPSLEKQNQASFQVNSLEQQVGFNPIQTQDKKEDKDDPFKYSASSSDSNGPKYTSSRDENKRILKIQRANPLEIKKNGIFESELKEVERLEYFEEKGFKSQNIESYVPIKKFDKDKVGKEDIFEKSEVKYSPSDY